MNAARTKLVFKLLLLLGLPLAVVAGLFGVGVYYGVRFRPTLLRFERDVLHLDVEVPPDEPTKVAEVTSTESASSEPSPGLTNTGAAAVDPLPSKPPHESGTEPTLNQGRVVDLPTPAHTGPISATEARTASDLESDGRSPNGTVGTAEVRMMVDPLVPELQRQWARPASIGLKVVVESTLTDGDDEWIEKVHRLSQQVSQVFRAQFGIAVELVALARWPIDGDRGRGSILIDSLIEQERCDSADVVVAITPRFGAESAEPPRDGKNGSHALVYAPVGRINAGLGGLLRSLARTYGAELIDRDTDEPAAVQSWMGREFTVEPELPVWIDPENRARVLNGKGRPSRCFQPAPDLNPYDGPRSTERQSHGQR